MKKYVLIAALLVALSLLFGCVNYAGDNAGGSTSDTINIGAGGEGTGADTVGTGESSGAVSGGAGESESGATSGTETGAGGTETGIADSGEAADAIGAGETGAATGDATTTAPQIYTINIQNFAFSPAQLTIKRGDSIIWTNLDSVAHTATSDTGAFDSGALGKNASWIRTFNEAGTFEYHCTPHPYMKAKIIVE
ncbi:MAG: cupredoxin family copper-binding protein [Candidatus Diapherotrites archaeon]|nr:cupredoxin family copper-binding protein [Candidatus Diapherotrites archaeon]